MKRIKTYEIANFKALEDEGPGKFQAVVSVFGNVDLQGDRVMPGAFKTSLAKWRRKGDPIPVIWSHDWLNPDAHIGFVDPEDAAEIVGDQKSNKGAVVGGLLVKGTIDVHKPFAAQVFDLLKSRRVKEWSFAYDINEEAEGKDGANELLDLDIHEIGPCLKGANPETYTVSAKAIMEKELKEAYDVDRSYLRLIDMLKSVEDPEVANMLTKTWTQGSAPALKTMKVSTLTEDELKALATGKSMNEIRDDEGLPPVVKVEYAGQEFNVSAEALELADADGEKDGGSKPWHVEKRGDQWCVIKDTDGSTVACHDSEEDANSQVRALYANEASTEPGEAKTTDTLVADVDNVTGHLQAEHDRVTEELEGFEDVRLQTIHRVLHGRGASEHYHEDEVKTLQTNSTSANTWIPVSSGTATSTSPITFTNVPVDDYKTRLEALEAKLNELMGEKDKKAETPAVVDPDADIKARLAALLEEEE